MWKHRGEEAKSQFKDTDKEEKLKEVTYHSNIEEGMEF